MRKIILICLVTLLFVTAGAPLKLVRLTLLNKSGYEVAVSLVESVNGGWTTDQNSKYAAPYSLPVYYLSSEYGDKEEPKETVWTIIPSTYDATVAYLSEGTIVYSYETEFDLLGRAKIVFLPPEKSGYTLCREQYEEELGKLAKCIDSLTFTKNGAERQYKFLPSQWMPYSN